MLRPGRIGLLLTALVCAALLGGTIAGCGAQLEEERRDGSNFNPKDFEQKEEQAVTIGDTPKSEKDDEGLPKDPDGLLHRVDKSFHPYLAEIRIHEMEDASEPKVMLVFRGGDAIVVEPADLETIRIIGVDSETVTVKVRKQEFQLRRGS